GMIILAHPEIVIVQIMLMWGQLLILLVKKCTFAYSTISRRGAIFVSHNCDAQANSEISNQLNKLAILSIGYFSFVHIKGTNCNGLCWRIIYSNKIVIAFTHDKRATWDKRHSKRFLWIPFFAFSPDQFSPVSGVTTEQKGNN